MNPNNFKKYLLLNSLITYSFCVIVIVILLTVYKNTLLMRQETHQYIYTTRSDGEVVPMWIIARRDNLEIEMKHHLLMFVQNFYGVNQGTYHANKEKALWLGDFRELYEQSARIELYNNIVTYSIEYSANVDYGNIELIEVDSDHYSFRMIIDISEKIGNNIRNFAFVSSGSIDVQETRNDSNPHALFIRNYIEESRIDSEN